jgi:outer membrane protein assembly factor BamE (lipoprotein component of BamABCDE complex)
MRPRVVDQKVVAVYFDKSKRVTRLAQYGLKDGRVFDFVSRTTPTGGREMTFLTQLMKGATAGIPLPTSKSSDPFGQ